MSHFKDVQVRELHISIVEDALHIQKNFNITTMKKNDAYYAM